MRWPNWPTENLIWTGLEEVSPDLRRLKLDHHASLMARLYLEIKTDIGNQLVPFSNRFQANAVSSGER
jgi:hypothetical protein